ncbi:MAG: hypothetical protein ABSE73_14350 [Planctomycetota bacterium]
MTEKYAATQPRTQASGPVEPKSITHIGGPLNGKKVADLGQNQRQTAEGDLYKRVRMDAGDQLGCICFDVLAYFGKAWEEGYA